MSKTKIPCPYCKATGTQKNKTEMVVVGVFTLGLFPLFEALMPKDGNGIFDENCESCNGKGYLTIIKEN